MTRRDGVFLRHGHFYISWPTPQGKRKRRKTEAKNVKEAIQFRAAEIRKGEQAQVLGFTPPTEETFDTVSAEYLKAQKAKLSPAGFMRERDIFALHLSPFFSGPLAAIKAGKIERYKNARSEHAAPATIRKELQVLNHFFRFAVRMEYLPVNPAAEVSGPKEPAGRVRYLQAEEIPLLLNACPPWLRPIVGFAVVTGMRLGEILALRWMDIDNRLAVLPKTKNGESRAVPLNDMALVVLGSLPPGKKADRVFPPVEGHRVSTAFKRVCRRMGVHDFRFHDLRHTFCSHQVMNGMSTHTLGQIVGHKTPRMTARYSHLSPEYLQKEVSRLDGAFSGLNFGDAVGTYEPLNLQQPATTCNKLLPGKVQKDKADRS